ncbi:MAG: cbb3-type cytochrome c oxidase subunit I [SAR324 cluster bacterium]|nr:cbb3-type cytochrome c oxidase subunit I [SAR324 cluster bacterium]
MKHDQSLHPEQIRLARNWLSLAIFTIVFAEMFALFAAGARTPWFHELMGNKNFFYVALVIHVNLAIVIWFLAFISLLYVLSFQLKTGPQTLIKRVGQSGLTLQVVGTLLMVMVPFIGEGTPIMSNYVPVLDHPLFFTALFLFFSGAALSVSLPFLMKKQNCVPLEPFFAFGTRCAGITFILALCCIGLAYYQMAPLSHSLNAFETVFWGGGHLLQAVNTLAMLSCWIFLIHRIYQQTILPDFLIYGLLGLIPLFALPGPFFYFIWDTGTPELTNAFTFLMRWGLGGSVILTAAGITRLLWNRRNETPWGDPRLLSVLISMGLFGYGGIVGTMIDSSNTTIPAHYHGVIGAVTIAFMGASFELLPFLNGRKLTWRFLRWQPVLCGLGGAFFVTGMFWAGSHGVARKVPGAAQGLDHWQKIAGMTLMGLGGLITVFGVILFIGGILKSLYRPETVTHGEEIQAIS